MDDLRRKPVSNSRFQRCLTILGLAGALSCASFATASPALATATTYCQTGSGSGPGGLGIAECFSGAAATNNGYNITTSSAPSMSGQYWATGQFSDKASVSASANGDIAINRT